MAKKMAADKPELDYTNVKPEEDGRPWYTPPPGYVAPPPPPPVPPVEGVSESDYEEVVRQLLLPDEKFWRQRATSSGLKKFVHLKTKPARDLIDSVLKINVNGPWPTLDDCIPKGSILAAVDKYFWENTDIPRELPFFNILHYVLAKLMQEGIEIHKGEQVILPDIWTIVVAPSGAGKSMTQTALARAMGGPVKLLPPGAKTSLQFLTYLRDYRLGLLLQDEFAQFLKSISKDSSMQDVRHYLLKTYDNETLEHKSTKSGVKAEKSAIGILGYTPVKTLTQYLTPEMMNDGFAQRFSYCVAEPDNRPIVGDYNFDGLKPLISPLWASITNTPFHPVYRVGEMGISAFDRVAQIIIGQARLDDVEDGFSRRLAFTTYKYGLAYHILTGKTDDVISPEDLAFGAQLTAMHLRHFRKVLDLYDPLGTRPAKASPKPLQGTVSGSAAATPTQSASVPKWAANPDVLAKVLAYLQKQKAAGAAPITAGKLQSAIRSLRGSAIEARAYAGQAIKNDPSLAPFIHL